MLLNIQYDEFAQRYRQGQPQIVYTSAVSDLETPVSAMIKLTENQPYSFLLESVQGGEIRGRYSFLGFDPDLVWQHANGHTTINRDFGHNSNESGFHPCPIAQSQDPLASLSALIQECRFDTPSELPPMVAGLFGYMGYDMVRFMERLPDSNPQILNTPESVFSRPTLIAIFDNIKDEVLLSAPVWPNEGVNPETAFDAACNKLAGALASFNKPVPHDFPSMDQLEEVPEPSSNVTASDYKRWVRKAKQYIYAGDIFQVVLSQQFKVPFKLPPFAFYRALRRVNPSPFLYQLNFPTFAIVGASPEILVRLRDGEVTVRPIAGTRRRGQTPSEDKALADDLLSDPKELAEHLMLLDLGRNDVGRVAEIGSVTVTEKNVVEYYSHVMHIISNVVGKAAQGVDALNALAAGFPAGTVSGAPKIRAMEIIDELENQKRGIYAGAIGYIAANGSMDTCIALRTAILKDGKLYVQAGAGVVADSDPELEYEECQNKARALFRAAAEAVRFASNKSN